MKTSKHYLAALGLISFLSFGFSRPDHFEQYESRRINSRSIASIEDDQNQNKEDEKKSSKVQDELKLSIKEKIEAKEKRIQELNDLIASYEKEQIDENSPKKCEEEIKLAKEELESLEIEVKELVALGEADVIIGKKEDQGICHKDLEQLSTLFAELIKQQQIVTQMYLYTTSMMLTTSLQQYYNDTFQPKYNNPVGENGISLSSILGADFDPKSFAASSNPQVYVVNNIQDQMGVTNLYNQYQPIGFDFSPQNDVIDVSRNPMYTPHFGNFQDPQALNHNPYFQTVQF
jgi:hypothetical protein